MFITKTITNIEIITGDNNKSNRRNNRLPNVEPTIQFINIKGL